MGSTLSATLKVSECKLQLCVHGFSGNLAEGDIRATLLAVKVYFQEECLMICLL